MPISPDVRSRLAVFIEAFSAALVTIYLWMYLYLARRTFGAGGRYPSQSVLARHSPSVSLRVSVSRQMYVRGRRYSPQSVLARQSRYSGAGGGVNWRGHPQWTCAPPVPRFPHSGGWVLLQFHGPAILEGGFSIYHTPTFLRVGAPQVFFFAMPFWATGHSHI